MSKKHKRLCVRFTDKELERLIHNMGPTLLTDVSTVVRAAVSMYCQHIETERIRNTKIAKLQEPRDNRNRRSFTVKKSVAHPLKSNVTAHKDDEKRTDAKAENNADG
jgi:hypothetical protein